MHRCQNCEKYCWLELPTDPFPLKDFLESFVETFGPKNTAESHHNVYNDFRYWALRNNKPSFALQGRRGTRFSWLSRNARFILLNRDLILEFGHLALKAGNKHENNHRLQNIVRRLQSDWGYIFTFLGAFTVLWSYLIKHLFSKFAKTMKQGEVKTVKGCKEIFESQIHRWNFNNPK